MTQSADFTAVSDATRVLPQHEAFVALLRSSLSSPDIKTIRWLDLGCGRGQVLLRLDGMLSENQRKKIEFTAYDIQEPNVRTTQEIADKLGFAGVKAAIGPLRNFDRCLEDNERYDFITLTNTVHEVTPSDVPYVLVDSILRLSDTGLLFVYDMETTDQLELGAVAWQQLEMQSLLEVLLRALNVREDFEAQVSRIPHTKVATWSIQLKWGDMGVARETASSYRHTAIQTAAPLVVAVLNEKLRSTNEALEAICRRGSQTNEDWAMRHRMLHDHWSIVRALGGMK